MTYAMWAILLIWTVLLIYALAASVDFGAGFWAMAFQGRSDGAAVIANRYVSPLWEVTNVFLVLFAVGFVGFFPQAAYSYGNILLVPGSLILLLLALRGSFLVFAYTTQKHARFLRAVSGITGLLLPGLFVSVLPISEGGFISQNGGHDQLLLGKLFASPIEYAYLVFGIATELFISALLMSDYSLSAGNPDAYQRFQRQAKRIGPITLLSALLVQVLMPESSSWLRIRLDAAWPAFLISFLSFAIGYSALWWKRGAAASAGLASSGRPRIAVIAIVVQYAIAQYAYGWAHSPYMLYPYLSLEDSFTNGPMFQALLIILVAGLAILFPAFIWFWRLFMEDKRYVRGHK